MRQIATVNVYDVMNTVQVHARVVRYSDDPETPPEVSLGLTSTIPGTGVTDPRLWLEDALVGLLEEL